MPDRLALGFNPVLPVKDAVRSRQEGGVARLRVDLVPREPLPEGRLSYLSAVLLSTSRIRAGSGAINTFTRHPLTAAATFASLSEISGGRVRMGLALGQLPDHPEHRVQDLPGLGDQAAPEDRGVRRDREELLGWREALVQGGVLHRREAAVGLQARAPVPLYIASLSRGRRPSPAADADGAILSPALATTETTSAMVRNVRRRERPRGGGRVDKASYLLTSVDEDGEKAAQRREELLLLPLPALGGDKARESSRDTASSVEEIETFRAAWKRGDPDASEPRAGRGGRRSRRRGDAARGREREIEEYTQGRGRPSDPDAHWKR